MTVVCAAKNCKYSSEAADSSHVVFINFPNDDTSKLWAHHCGRTDLLLKSNEEIHLNYYICSHHIEDRFYINRSDPVIIEENAVPTLFDEDQIKDSCNIFTRNDVDDTMSLPYSDIDVEVDQYHGVGVRFSNLCRICGESSTNVIDIFNDKGIRLKVREKIKMHMPITVDMVDMMPQKLCENCYNKLEMIHALTVICLKTDIRLKRFLNIGGVTEYDNRYNELLDECTIELAQDLCMEAAVQAEQLDLPSEKIQKLCDNFENPTSNEVQSSLENLLDCYSKIDEKRDESLIKLSNVHETADVQRNQMISPLHCEDTLKSQEIFKNHKLLCNDEELLLQKEKELPTDDTFEMSKDVEANLCCRTPDLFDDRDFNLTRDECNTNCNLEITRTKRCGHCDIVYPTKKELLNHITESHGGLSLFKCFTCDKTYEKWSGLDVHEATHRVDKPYLCDLCGKRFKHSNNLRGHKRIHLEDCKKKRHVCDICGNNFRSRFHLREHMNQHEDNKPYSCEQCGKAFHKRIQLRQHKLSHGLNKHVCPVCGASFNRRGNMTAHLKRHTNVEEMYTCSVCALKYKTMSALLLHRKVHTKQDIVDSIKRKSSSKSIWECKICNRVFSKRTVLLYHERLHTGEKVDFECNECDKKLSSKQSLIYHKKCIHSSERLHMCQYCGESFVSKEARQIHERLHTGERPYICEICNMRYKCSSNLNQHMKIHLGVKPHKCSFCHKSFTRKDTLNVHERIHTGVKPFPCEICGRNFSQRNDMLKHARTHASKEMQCELCNQVFTRRKDILKHIGLHHHNSAVVEEYESTQVEMISTSTEISPI